MPIQHTAKMNRIILLLIVLAASAIGASAQSQIATLSHEGAVTPYYGYDALEMALANCQDGDIITLSPGMFKAAEIKKSITLRGYSAWEEDKQTIVSGDLFIPNDDNNSIKLSIQIEGIRSSNNIFVRKPQTDITISKSYVNGLYEETNGSNISLFNCQLYGWRLLGKGSKYNVSNCQINHASTFGGIGGPESSTIIINSIISAQPGQSGVTYSSLTNCVLLNMEFETSNNYTNCLSHKKISTGMVINCYLTENSESPFKDDTFYELKEQYAEIMGNDGTQVGIYGGLMPWSWAPSQPKITKFNVARRTNADGKLPVEIEVESPNN